MSRWTDDQLRLTRAGRAYLDRLAETVNTSTPGTDRQPPQTKRDRQPAGPKTPAGPGTLSPPAHRVSSLALVIPMPPSTNSDKAGGYFLTDETRAFRRAVKLLAQTLKNPRVEGRIRLTLTFYGLGRTSDLDNRIKPALDALQGAGIIPNDRWVDSLTVERATTGGQQECAVRIDEIGALA